MVNYIMQRRHGLGRVSKISRRKTKLDTCTDMHLDPNAFQYFVIVFRAFMDRITLYVYNIKSSVQSNLPFML